MKHDDGPQIADAAFIAASRTDVPALLAHIAAIEAERDALAAKIAGMEKALSVLTDPGHCHIYGDGSVTLGYPGRIEDCYSAKCREQIAALAEAPATDEPECVCYESWAGHQSGCAFAKRGPATEGETK
jgi:hypothetical protein